VDARYTKEYLGDRMSVRDYANWATKYVDDNLGAK
jgi:hypothetical protein